MNCDCFRNVFSSNTTVNRNQNNEHYEVNPPKTLVHTDAVCAVAAANNNCILSGSKDKSLVLYDVGKNVILDHWLGHDQEITRVTYGNKKDIYLSAGRDKLVHLWQHGNKDRLLTFLGHDLVINGLALNADNTVLCTGSRDNTVRFWNVTTGQCIKTCSISRNLVTWVSWCKKSNSIVQSSEDKEVRLWDARSMDVVRSFPRKQYIQTCCDITDDGLTCISTSNGFGGHGCEVTVWDVRQGQMLHELSGHGETVNCCVLLPPGDVSGQPLAVTSSNDTTIRVWNITTGECCNVTEVPASGPVTCVSYSSDNKRLAASTFNSGIHVFKLYSQPSSTQVRLTEEMYY